MTSEELDQLLELLCGFACTYALDSADEQAVDRAIELVEMVIENEKAEG